MKQKHIVFLESNPTTGLRAIQEAKTQLGYRITFITSDLDFYLKGKALSSSPIRFADRILEVNDSGSFEAMKSQILGLHSADKIDSFMSFSEYHMFPSAQAAEFLGLRHISSKATARARNKHRTRRILSRGGVMQPKFKLVKSIDESISCAEKLGYPLIVKPVDGTASLNTRIVKNSSELCEQVRKILSISDYGRSTKPSQGVLLEEYINAPVVSVEALTIDGQHYALGITDRVMVGEPYFVEGGYSFPATLKNNDEIIKVAFNALDKIGVKFGPTHIELFLTPQGPSIVEINCRLAGGVIPQLIELTTGRSLLLDIIRVHTGESIDLNTNNDGVGTARFFYADETGIVQNLTKSAKAADPRVKEYIVNVEPGKKINAIESNFDRLGYVITHDKERESSENLCQAVLEETVITVAPTMSSVAA